MGGPIKGIVGTVSFLNLARSCRALYTSLAPEHFEYFEFADTYRIAEQAIKRGPGIASVPYGLGLVGTLDVICGSAVPELKLQCDLIAACPNITELVCSWEQLTKLMWEKKRLVMDSLEDLDLHFSGYDGECQARPWKGLRNLKRLRVNQIQTRER